jgi:SH3-like domain-containing protein
MAGPAVSVEGLRELDRAFARAGEEVNREMPRRLESAARPVERTAEALAVTTIRNMRGSPEWANMRIGSNRDFVYVAPVKRGTKISTRKRRGFARLLINRAMQPAVDHNAGQVRATLDDMLARMQRRWENS